MIEYPRYLLNQIKHQPKLIYHSTFSPISTTTTTTTTTTITFNCNYTAKPLSSFKYSTITFPTKFNYSSSNRVNIKYPNNNNNNNNINNGNSPTIKLPPIVNYPSKSLPSPCYQNLIHQYHHHKHLIHRVLNLNCLIYPGY